MITKFRQSLVHPRIAYAIAGIGFLFALTGWYYAGYSQAKLEQQNLANHADDDFKLIERRLLRRVQLLTSLKALMASQPNVSRLTFHRFVESMQVDQYYLGVLALQFARYVPHTNKTAFEKKVRQDRSLEAHGYPNYKIFPPGERAFYVAVEYNEPMKGNEAAFGHDNAEEAVRRAVLELARDTGEAAISGPIKLLQDPQKRPGFVIRVPIYRFGVSPKTVEQRRANYIGQVSGVFFTHELFADRLLGIKKHSDHITLYDLGPVRGGKLDPTAKPIVQFETGQPIQATLIQPTARFSKQLQAHGRAWLLEYTTPYKNPWLTTTPLLIGFTVLSIFLFIAWRIWEMLNEQKLQTALVQSIRAELKDSEGYANTLLQSALDSIVCINDRGIIEHANHATTQLFGYTQAELIGQNVSLLMPDSTARAHDGYVKNAANHGPAKIIGTTREVVGKHKDGQLLSLELSINRINVRGRSKFVGSLRDLTQRLKIEQERTQMQQKLQQQFTAKLERMVAQRTVELQTANREMEAFTYTVSHDLRAPLRHINGFAEMLQTRYAMQLDPRGQNFIERIAKSARQMGQLVDDLLAFSRVGRQEIELNSVDLTDLVAEVMHTLSPDHEHRQIHWAIPPLPTVWGDPSLLRQVFINLIGNAIKYSSKREWADIAISCELVESPTEDPQYLFTIRDNGAGFDMKFLNKLFGVFQRLHHASEFEGTGVGLAIVKQIIIRHGGRIWAEGEVDKGAAFHFTLKPATKN